MIIREITKNDNPIIEKIIKDTIIEFGLPKTGTAYEDADTLSMFESYQNEKEVYLVIDNEKTIMGGAGVKALKNNSQNICELQKMYFNPKARGKGYGKLLIETCLKKAKDFGYSHCYIETDPGMESAIHLYKKNGFRFLEKPLGNTGHSSCSVWMLKNL